MPELRQADRRGIAFLRFLRLSAHTTASHRGRRTGCLRCDSSRHSAGDTAHGGYRFRSRNGKRFDNAHSSGNNSGSVYGRADRPGHACCAAKPADAAIPNHAGGTAVPADATVPDHCPDGAHDSHGTASILDTAGGHQSHRRRFDQAGIHQNHGRRSRHRPGGRPGARPARVHRVLLRGR